MSEPTTKELLARVERLEGQLKLRASQHEADSRMYHLSLRSMEEACAFNFNLALANAPEWSAKADEHSAFARRQLAAAEDHVAELQERIAELEGA